MDILKLFQYNQKMKFSDIERALKVRSNKLAYHLNNLTKKGILTRENNFYFLSETSEHLVPYLSERDSTLAVVLIHLGNSKQTFLIKRTKRPFKDQLSLPGGRILTGESLEQASKRIMKEKFNIKIKLEKINSISLEHLKKNDKILHSFLLILVSASTKDKIQLTNIKSNKSKIVTSDYLLIQSDLNKKLNIKTINTLKI